MLTGKIAADMRWCVGVVLIYNTLPANTTRCALKIAVTNTVRLDHPMKVLCNMRFKPCFLPVIGAGIPKKLEAAILVATIESGEDNGHEL